MRREAIKMRVDPIKGDLSEKMSRPPRFVIVRDRPYDPFEGEYNERRVTTYFREERSVEEFVELLERLRVPACIEEFHASGYGNNQEATEVLPANFRRLILVCQRIYLAIWNKVGKYEKFLSLRPPILQDSFIQESQFTIFGTGDHGGLLRAFMRYYPMHDWCLLITKHVESCIGRYGDTDLLDKLVENNVQPTFRMLQSAITALKLGIIDRLFAIPEGPLRPLRADNVGDVSLFVLMIDARDRNGDFVYSKDVMQRLFMYGANPNGNGTRPLPLEEAFYRFNFDAIEELLSYGANPNVVFEQYGIPALIHAVKMDFPLSIIELLVAHGVDVNRVHKKKRAVDYASGEVRDYLLAVGNA